MFQPPPRTVRQQASRIFSDDLWGKLADLNGLVDVDAVLHPMLFLGRNPTSSGVVPANINARGRLMTERYDEVTLIADSGSIAGNVSASVTPTAAGTYEILGIVQSYVCDATAAARVTIVPTFTGINDAHAALLLNSGAKLQLISTLALSASQDGVISLGSGGVETKNLNGTPTLVTGRAVLPQIVVTTSGIIINFTAATNGVAGDSQRIAIVGRQIA